MSGPNIMVVPLFLLLHVGFSYLYKFNDLCNYFRNIKNGKLLGKSVGFFFWVTVNSVKREDLLQNSRRMFCIKS